MFQHGAGAVKEAVVDESSSDPARVVVTLGDSRGKCCGADEVRQNQNAHVEHMYAISYCTGKVEKRGFASRRYVATDVVIQCETPD